MKANNPIGIFDSGVGGTSIWKEIHQLLPNESTIYLADSHHAPYGIRTPAEIVDLSIKNTDRLLEFGAKLVVVACNTATTNAISLLRKKYDIPFVGIEPAIKPAALHSKTGKIGILATRGTLSSALFSQTSEEFTKDISVVEVVGEGLVPLIENGEFDNPLMEELLRKYTEPMIEANVDYLVLGCSHYPYLIPKLTEILPKQVKIIDSGIAVARQTKFLLEKHNLIRTDISKPSLEFFSNADTATLEFLLADYDDIVIQYRDF
ncbi:MAG: glutamate racemase [Bacteroidia bacterium]|nr:glutamate racemase [Bacteroidia bacterium]NNF32305.1 glutamate racemase [Flavobacteriaceae bacterium]MBT8276105.1 glutamate racemase [Bacteroidia bacterium]NNJ83009.1 glutamate racemase [Flavobacteriaceae bacterium]NNK53931.1 glutamate racemase [Flavobacteriaceae bacterium]